jgi:hypothetical protein
MPKFRVLSDAEEQLAAYQADRRRKLVPPDALGASVRGVDAFGHLQKKPANRNFQELSLADLRERPRTLHRKPNATRKGPKQTWIAERLRKVRAKVSDLLDDEVRCHLVRRFVMRWSLGVVFAWFAAQQLYDPDGWVNFVPSFMQGVAGLPEATLIRLHGSLLLLAAVGLIARAGVRLAAGLAATILVQIIGALVLNGGEANLVRCVSAFPE